MRISGGIPVGGNLGVFSVAGGNPLLDPRFKIQGGEPWNKTPILPGKETKEFENQPFPAPALPPGAGNLLAQGIPPMSNAGALGAPMQMGPRFGPRPLNIDINAVDDRLESVGGSANIQLDRDQALRLGGTFNPGYTDGLGIQNPQGYELFGEYTTPSLGINVNYRNTRGNPSAIGAPGGFPGQVQAGFKGRF
jgi:hypothetical protein